MTPRWRLHTRTWRTAALIVTVLVCTVLGGQRAASILAGEPGRTTLVVDGVTYTVAYSEQVKGPSDANLGGMSHGVQSLVTDDKALVKVMLIVTAGDSPASFDPSALRALATGSSVWVAPTGGTLAPGRLSANARMEGSLSFIFPRNGAQLTLRAPGGSREVPLLQVDAAPSGAGQHPHPTTTHAAKRVITTPAPKRVKATPAAKRVTATPAAKPVTVTITPADQSGKNAIEDPAEAPRPPSAPAALGP